MNISLSAMTVFEYPRPSETPACAIPVPAPQSDTVQLSILFPSLGGVAPEARKSAPLAQRKVAFVMAHFRTMLLLFATPMLLFEFCDAK
jgi:hypothetical protein